MSPTPPPVQSPKPAYVPPSSTTTGEWKIQLDRKIKVGSIVVGLTLIDTVAAGILTVQNEARAEAKKTITTELADDRAQSKVVEFRLSLLEKDRLQQADTDRAQNAAVNAANLKLDALLDKMRIPNPAPTPPADGGSP